MLPLQAQPFQSGLLEEQILSPAWEKYNLKDGPPPHVSR